MERGAEQVLRRLCRREGLGTGDLAPRPSFLVLRVGDDAVAVHVRVEDTVCLSVYIAAIFYK